MMHVRAPEALQVQLEVAVAVTSRLIALITLLLFSLSLSAAQLPEDQADLLYHAYEGGGVEVTGPSYLVRKKVLDELSISANYYVDMVTSASIDVVTTASEYTEERTQTSIGFDYLMNKTVLSLNFTNSTENDYVADTFNFSISQDFFSNLSNISLSYGLGNDVVGINGQDEFSEDIVRQNYRVDFSQVITKNLLLSLAVEGITDEGFLNNPYRQVRYLDATEALGYSYQLEIYPETRTSNAFALTGKYFLPFRAAIYAEYRAFSDTWGIEAFNYELGYIHPLEDNWTFEISYRYYDQQQADFYADLFPFRNAQNFIARDKELSTYTSHALMIGATYDFKMDTVFTRGSLNFYYNHLEFEYENFRDLTVLTTPGEEPLYGLDAGVIRAFASFWF